MARKLISRRVIPRIFIAHRGSAALANPSPPPPRGADAVVYVASVLDGPCDLELTVAQGVVQALTPAPGRSLEWMEGTVGPFPVLVGGYGWAQSGGVNVAFACVVAQDTFQTCTLGVVEATTLADGPGWSGVGGMALAHVRQAGAELFEQYALGPATPGVLNGGSGWAAPAVVVQAG